MSAERLNHIDSLLNERYIEPGKISGALTLVARHGEIVHFSTLGQMDVERDKATERDTIYRIYSMTKPITSVALMMLFEEGRFQLSDPLHEYLPEWASAQVYVSGDDGEFETRPPDRPITVRDLLTHQSGLGYGATQSNPVDAAHGKHANHSTFGAPLSEWSAALSKLPLLFSPGTAWNYSVSTDLCGYLVEAISGKPFDRFLRDNIFEPLGMIDTGFYVPDEKIARFATCYEPDGAGGILLQDDPETSKYRSNPALFSGGGGLVSTATDYYRFCQMLLNGGSFGDNRLLGRKTIDLMTRNHLTDGAMLADMVAPASRVTNPVFAGLGFGLGFAVLMDPAKSQVSGSVGRYHWSGAASTYFWIDPVEDLAVVFLSQLLPGAYPIRPTLQAMVDSAIED